MSWLYHPTTDFWRRRGMTAFCGYGPSRHWTKLDLYAAGYKPASIVHGRAMIFVPIRVTFLPVCTSIPALASG